MTLSSARMPTRMVSLSMSWSSEPSSRMWLSRTTDPRLQTAVSSSEVLSVISVQRLLLWMTPVWSCGERRLHGSLNVIHGWPVSKIILSIFFHMSMAGSCLDQILPSAAIFSYSV